jgi:hypothetical protein
MRCWYTRWQMSNALDRGDLASRMTRGHAARCAACQAFGRALGSLDAQLARGAHSAPVPVIAVPRRWRLLPIAAPLAVTAAAVIAIVVSGISPVERIVESPQTPAAPSLGALVGVRRVADRVTRVLTSTPLDTELDDLIADSKRGLDAVLALGGLR